MKNIIQLRKELCAIFNGIRGDTISLQRAKELTNNAGKIIGSVKLELEYANLRKEIPVIDFLGGSKTPAERNRQ